MVRKGFTAEQIINSTNEAMQPVPMQVSLTNKWYTYWG